MDLEHGIRGLGFFWSEVEPDLSMTLRLSVVFLYLNLLTLKGSAQVTGPFGLYTISSNAT